MDTKRGDLQRPLLIVVEFPGNVDQPPANCCLVSSVGPPRLTQRHPPKGGQIEPNVQVRQG